jgi:acyl carrier protein
MTKEQFYALLDELLEQDPGTIKGEELLISLQRWDSLAVIGFIAMLDEHFSISVNLNDLGIFWPILQTMLGQSTKRT